MVSPDVVDPVLVEREMRQGGLILAAGRARSKKKKRKKTKFRRTQNTPRNPKQPGDRDHLETS